MKSFIKKIPYLFICFTLIVSCEDFDTDLDVPNLEHPNDLILTSDPVALQATAGTLFRNWYMANSSTGGPGFAFNTMADVSSCSWGNFGMRDTSSEPRIEWNNTPSYGSQGISNNLFNSLYSILSDSNTLVSAVENGTEFEDPNLILAIAKFGQALSIGYNALVFDKVWLSDETGVIGEDAVGYQEAMAFALSKLDEGIAVANQNSFTVPSTWFPGNEMDNTSLAKLMSSFGARLLVMNSRNSSQKAATDWNKVKAYAEGGVTEDFMIFHDDTSWYDLIKTYLVYPGWGRIDMRIVNMLDPNMPDYWPDGETILPEATSDDARLETDFQYLNSQGFRPERGTYHYSNYRYSRWDDYITEWVYPTVEMAKAENDMYLAEANLQLGNLSVAADIINAGTRVTRGNLSPVAVAEEDIAYAIFYERMIEMPIHSSGLVFFEMRKENLLQTGTFLHFPVPGAALESIPAPIYTFGGTTGEPGVDYSTGGWR